ncbi:MAG TPA: sugar ABC transporter permease [Candidatus Alectryocaccomicrobium excrementavium]|uniref:Sugar ABC transporter permease n=1 Tax=Candidatus Alectryocaccomicrobium excrementavium TaxID=2840668 RepID=A0A9D1K7T7_9FIRM|nr:sugar ABC transporter permease [Candidatus Alectryocaccomicrobium excrementavium]
MSAKNTYLTRAGARDLTKRIWNRKFLYLLFLPVALNFILFHYWPMAGLQIAFKRYNIVLGLGRSPWLGLENFQKFFGSYYFAEVLRNTIVLNLLALCLSPLPIVLALMLNEVRSEKYRRAIQTMTYLPYFISIVVVVGMLKILFASDGAAMQLIYAITGTRPQLLAEARYFRGMYLMMEVWRCTGYESIIYIAAMSSINPECIEAACVDGANRFQRMIHVTVPGIMSTIVILLIMRMGSMLGSGYETILLMQTGLNESVSETIQTFVYKRGLQSSDFGYATAVGFFQSVISFALVMLSNWIAKRATDGEYRMF